MQDFDAPVASKERTEAMLYRSGFISFIRGKVLSMFLALMLVVIFSFRCWAQAPAGIETREPEKIRLVVGKSIILTTLYPVKRVSVANPKIADVLVIPPRQVYLTGKAVGTTNLTIWRQENVSTIYDVKVVSDLSGLKEKLHEVLPEEENVRVTATHNSVTLSGTITSTANITRVLALAEAYVPKEKVINLLQVAGVQQVMLEVRVAEMSRSLMNRLGFNIAFFSGEDLALSMLNNLTQLKESMVGGEILFSPTVNALFRFHKGQASWTGFIDALKEDGLLKILAEPTLIALSGQSADFLAGGEFPIPVPQGLGTVAIEYKTFGVGLIFTPTVLNDNIISMKVSPEVSELDFSISVTLAGFAVPGLTTRRASTTIELADGQSFAIAGLLRETVRESIRKFPLLGDIPILGALFRSSEFQKNESELVIIVTPHLMKPLDMAKQTLPTDRFIEPDDAEFFLLGIMEGRGETGSARVPIISAPSKEKGGMEGDFGHITK